MVIKNCVLTQSDAEVTKTYLDSDEIAQKYKEELHSGVDVKCSNVYSVSPGVVMLVGKNNVIVQSDLDHGYNYCHLKTIDVRYYDTIQVGQKIGVADEFVHFEAFGPQQSRWPVRIGLKTWYKFDPIHVLEEGYTSNSTEVPAVTPGYGQVYLGDMTLDIEMDKGRGYD